jgi:HK97 family phage major capsid protein
MPPGGLSGAPYATLMGRPVIVSEFATTLGTVGDIMLVDLSQYITLTKGAMETAMSMHLYFDTAEMAFRTTYRVDGQCWWNSALTPYQGIVTKSPVVVLATRS